MDDGHQGMVAQPKDTALEEAASIKAVLQSYEGKDLGYGLVYKGGALVSEGDDEASPYFTGEDGEPLTFHHYRNLSTVSQPGNEDFHDLMHFGTLRAAFSRAFSKRLLQNGQQFTEKLIGTDVFNRCANISSLNDGDFGEEKIFSVKLKAKNPFFIPDIGQTQYFKNRAVLYACGLFDEAEVDGELFDDHDFPQPDINQKVIERLQEKGFDSIAYLNSIEDPDSMSLLILNKAQAEAVDFRATEFPGFRYRFGPPEDTRIVECDKAKNIHIVPNAGKGPGGMP